MGHRMTGDLMRRVIAGYKGNSHRRVAASVRLFQDMHREVKRCLMRYWDEGKFGPQPQFPVDWESLLTDSNQNINDMIDIITRYSPAPIDSAFLWLTNMISLHYPKMKGQIKEILLVHIPAGDSRVDYKPDEGCVVITYTVNYFGIPQQLFQGGFKALFARYFK